MITNFPTSEYSDLAVGQTRQGACPNCGKRKFYVTRKADGWLYICHRASCATGSGFQPAKTTAPTMLVGFNRKPAKRKQFMRPMRALEVGELAWFHERFGIDYDSPTHALPYIKRTDDGRFVFPIYGPYENYRGIVVRRPSWTDCPYTDNCHDEMPKSLTYLEDGTTCRNAWYHSMNERKIVVVEDQVSAQRIASEGWTSLALLGTDVGMRTIQDMLRFKPAEEYIFAFDPDASIKAITACLKFGAALPKCRAAIMEADPKDYGTSRKLIEDLGL